MEGLNLPSDSSVDVFTAEERPELWETARTLFRDVWPEYNVHGNDTPAYFGALFPEHAAFQILIVERDTDQVVARGRSIPFRWDGSKEDLPHGIDAVGLRAVETGSAPTALSALAAEVAVEHQGRGISGLLIQSMAAAARVAGFEWLVAPVRPSWKDRYPLTPIERYAAWTRDDGLPFDPWLRVHARLGAVAIRPEPQSLRIEAAVASGNAGRRWCSRKMATMSSLPALHRCWSEKASVSTGSRTSGCCTRSDRSRTGQTQAQLSHLIVVST